LAPVDFTFPMGHALRRAALIAADHAAEIVLLHVVSRGGFEPLRKWLAPRNVDAEATHARAKLDRLAADLGGTHRIQVHSQLRIGDRYEEIADAARRTDLVVLGANRRNALRDFVVGTPAVRLLRTAERPVLIVKQPPLHRYRRVLVPVDFSESSAAALRIGAGVAHRGVLHVFHALDTWQESKLRAADVAPDIVEQHRARAMQQAYRRMRTLVAAAAPSAANCFSVERGDAARLILGEAHTNDADLIVIGKTGLSAVADFLLGSVVQRVLRDASCDTLLVPARSPAVDLASSRRCLCAPVPVAGPTIRLPCKPTRKRGVHR
jgi:nucleotide-binding universal stress UspA family protein